MIHYQQKIILFISLLLLIPIMGFSAKKKITVYTIGDSTMANKDTIGNPERGWGMALPLFFDSAEVVIYNHAVNGRSTKSFIDEGRWDVILKTLKKGDYVFIQFGHNDEKQDQPSLYAAPYKAYTENLIRFVNETRAKGAFPVLMTSIVRRYFDEHGTLKNSHGDYPYAVRKLAKELKVPMIDMEAKSRKMIQELGDTASKKLFMNFNGGIYSKYPKGKKDDTHLRWNGAESIASLAVEGLRELNLPLAEYLKPALFERKRTTYMYIDENEKPVVYSAFTMLQSDVKTVFDTDLKLTTDKKKARIIVSSSRGLQSKWETFQIDIQNDKLFILGSDARGKAYGILELSRSIGVSPWEWWADATPEKRSICLLAEIERSLQSPSVQYRGIFLNDEDWGLLPWANEKFHYELIDGVKLSDKNHWKGAIGPGCYERIFQLLLRLRANALWPAMHECTVPFYFVKGNKEMAEKYGIIVGTSHCEPMMRNSASEWDISSEGDYNFITNRKNVLGYWTERLKELEKSENLFTIGMRGKHDGIMQGVKTLEEHKNTLSQIILAQQELLKKHINPQPEKIPQFFIPYKEVLDVYDNNFEVPDYVTLVWCDDNYGYINRLSDDKEQLRKGGAGVYYHISYWGQPHDYLWLASTSPALVYTEMKRAYEHNAKKLWILNVGDIKPAEYLTEFFMDMAWNIHSITDEKSRVINIFSHLNQWAKREFGRQNADKITDIMKEYYRLANFRKPEFTGWNRVEEYKLTKNRDGITPITDSEYNPSFRNELQNRIDDYLSLGKLVEEITQNIPDNKKNAFFQLVEYPVESASLINQKWLYAQLAGHYSYKDSALSKEYAGKSLCAYNNIERITEKYNKIGNGKWNGIMNFHPRDLPVFAKPEFALLDSLTSSDKKSIQTEHEEIDEQSIVLAQNAVQAITLPENARIIEGLGHSFSAVQIQRGDTLDFVFDIPAAGDYWIKIATLPNHDVDSKGMKINLFIDGKRIKEFDYQTVGRSETWKKNVLRGQAISSVKYYFPQVGKATVSIDALTPYVILDQIMIEKGTDHFYEFPVKQNDMY